MIPSVTNFCENSSSQPILQLFDDKCFKIIEGSDTLSQFCLSDFAMPSDGHQCFNISISSLGEFTMFDNGMTGQGSPLPDLTTDQLYIRSVFIYVDYPTVDENGEEIDIKNKNVQLWIEDAESLTYKKHPLYNLFMLTTNPKSSDPITLINRIKIVNPNADFKISIRGLATYGKAE